MKLFGKKLKCPLCNSSEYLRDDARNRYGVTKYCNSSTCKAYVVPKK